jgi:hypothetical protein
MEHVVHWENRCTESESRIFVTLYFEKRKAEAEHDLGSGAARNIPNHILGREYQKKRAGTCSFSKHGEDQRTRGHDEQGSQKSAQIM